MTNRVDPDRALQYAASDGDSCTVGHHSGTGVAVYEQKAATTVLAVVVQYCTRVVLLWR